MERTEPEPGEAGGTRAGPRSLAGWTRGPRGGGHLPAVAALTSTLWLSACVSDFVFEVPEDHPAEPSAPAAGPLRAPSPFEVEPPRAASDDAEGSKMHNLHGEPAEPSDEDERHGHEAQAGGR